MKDGDEELFELTPQLLVRAYCVGVFPMARSADDPQLYWLDPDPRGVLPLDAVHVPRSLRKVVRRGSFRVTVDQAFRAVMDGCAESRPGREDTWINPAIFKAFGELHDLGVAHSVECWQGDDLVGGLYGLALAGAFFGESMFSRVPEASKVALVHLVARLRYAGFSLLDTQFQNAHLARFGVIEIPKQAYHARLNDALERPVTFPLSWSAEDEHLWIERVLQDGAAIPPVAV